MARYPEAIMLYPRSMQIFIKTVSNRIDAGKNALPIVVGPTGSGKSLSTISLMIGIYSYRNGKMPSVEYVEEHCVFRALNLLTKLNNQDKLVPGEMWNWDEAGFDISHKTHASVQNRVVSWLTQTFRNMQQIVFFTVPSISMIDATVRKLLHYYLETCYIEPKEKICVIKPLIFQYNTRMDKMYYHNLTFPTADGLEEVEFMGVPLPPKEYVEAYEKKKNIFTKDLNLELQGMLESLKNGRIIKLTERQEKILDFFKQGVTVRKEIAARLGVQPSVISENIRFMRNKGVEIDKLLKENEKNTKLVQINAQAT